MCIKSLPSFKYICIRSLQNISQIYLSSNYISTRSRHQAPYPTTDIVHLEHKFSSLCFGLSQKATLFLNYKPMIIS